MKRLITLITLLLAYSMMLYIKSMQDVSHTQVISLLKYHYVVDTLKSSIWIPIFISNQDHEILNLDSIDRIQLINQDIKMDVDILKIEYQHNETYDEINYYMYQYEIELPMIEHAFLMEEVSIHITLDNTLAYTLEIGSVEFFLKIDTFDSNWDFIDAKRYIEVLSIDYLNIQSEYEIKTYISIFTETHQDNLENLKKLYIQNQEVLFWDVPIILEYEDFKEMIVGINWISSKRILTQTEDYHVAYIWYGSQSRETL